MCNRVEGLPLKESSGTFADMIVTVSRGEALAVRINLLLWQLLPETNELLEGHVELEESGSHRDMLGRKVLRRRVHRVHLATDFLNFGGKPRARLDQAKAGVLVSFTFFRILHQ